MVVKFVGFEFIIVIVCLVSFCGGCGCIYFLLKVLLMIFSLICLIVIGFWLMFSIYVGLYGVGYNWLVKLGKLLVVCSCLIVLC